MSDVSNNLFKFVNHSEKKTTDLSVINLEIEENHDHFNFVHAFKIKTNNKKNVQ